MSQLSPEAIRALDIIKEETAKDSVNIQTIIDAINNDETIDDIVTLIGDNAISYLIMDDGFILSRVIIHMLSSEQRKSLFVDLGISLITTLNKISTPIDENEELMKNDLHTSAYYVALFGNGFVNDIISILDSAVVSVVVKRWVRGIFCAKMSKRPPWVNVKEGDDIKSVNVKSWSIHRDSTILKEMISKNECEIDWVRVDDTQDDTKAGDVFGYDLEICRNSELRNRYATIPKRGITVRDSILSDPNRIFGPLNSHIQSECDEGMDGCRMLLCTCHGGFDGACDMCGLKIKDRSYTVRYPHEDGGWIGEYCSMNCMMNDNPANSRSEDLDLMSTGITDRVKLRKI